MSKASGKLRHNKANLPLQSTRRRETLFQVRFWPGPPKTFQIETLQVSHFFQKGDEQGDSAKETFDNQLRMVGMQRLSHHHILHVEPP